MTKSSFRVSAELIADLLIPSRLGLMNVEHVTFEHGSLTFHVEHDRHDIPEGEVQLLYKTVGPVIGGHGAGIVTVFDKAEAVKAPAPLSEKVQRQIDAVFPVPGDEHRGTGRSFKQLTELILHAYNVSAPCVFVTPGAVDYHVNLADRAAKALNIMSAYYPNMRVLTVAPGSIRFVAEKDFEKADCFGGLDIKRIVWDHACIDGGLILDNLDPRTETKPAAVPSTAPSPKPNSPTPAPAPNTTNAPPAPETKEGGIGQAIDVTRREQSSTKP